MKSLNNKMKFENIQLALGVNFVNSLVNISISDKFVWIKNPKVGSSTLDKTLQAVAGRQLDGLSTKPHSSIQDSVFIKPYQLPNVHIERILASDKYFKFTFARNPYSRLFSAYTDKIAGNKRNKVQILRYLRLDPSDIEQDVSFDQFIYALSLIDPLKMDRHWMPQYLLTSANYIDFDFVGRLETFDQDLNYIFNKLGLDIGDYYEYYAPHRNKKGSTLDEHLEAQCTLDIINTVYGEDFTVFDYPVTNKLREFATS